MDKYISELDTLRFGFKVAKINNFFGAPQTVVQGFKQQGVQLIISRVGTGDINLINQMEDAGFRLKDVQLTFNFDLNNSLPLSITEEHCCYRAFLPEDTSNIVRIAAESFKNYGHYSRSAQTNSVNSNIIYEDWARRSCISKDVADHIVVAEIDGNVAGFLSFKIGHDEHTRVVAGVMGAVAKEYRKGGIFRGINVESLHWAKEQSICRVENNVLITNFAVIKTYTSLGFEVIRSEATFHCWLG